MRLHSVPPPADLVPFVRGFFFVENLKKEGEDDLFKLFPIGTPNLIFYPEGEVATVINNIVYKGETLTVNGQIMKYFTTIVSPGAKFAGIAFQPTGMYRLFGLNAELFTNRMLPAGNFLEVKEYIRDLNEASSQEEIMSAHLTFLRSKLPAPNSIWPVVEQCIHDINRLEGSLKVDQLADKYNCSGRYLEKHFTYSVGISPGKYRRRVRFYNVLKRIIIAGARIDMILPEFDFYDRSHFSKDFEYFMGEKPRVYFESRHSFMKNIVRKGYFLITTHRS